jgi:hypothetical protein
VQHGWSDNVDKICLNITRARAERESRSVLRDKRAFSKRKTHADGTGSLQLRRSTGEERTVGLSGRRRRGEREGEVCLLEILGGSRREPAKVNLIPLPRD